MAKFSRTGGRKRTEGRLSIIQLNCRSWTTRKSEIQTRVQQTPYSVPDVYLLQEHLQRSLSLTGYVSVTPATEDGHPPPRAGILMRNTLPHVALDTQFGATTLDQPQPCGSSEATASSLSFQYTCSPAYLSKPMMHRG